MKTIKNFFRLLYIQYILAKYGFDRVIFSAPAFSSFKFLSYLNPWNWRRKKHTRGETIRIVFEKLGPIFVKFGQQLSTRRDLLPDDIIAELVKLQDQVTPFPSEMAKAMIEASLGNQLSGIFAKFEDKPLASASIAQVHAAELNNGQKVVVKILRPNIYKIIRRDIGLMMMVAKLAEKFSANSRRLKPTGIVKEFENNLIDEIDLMREGANASQLRRNFLHSHLLYIPEVDWEYTRSNMIVMERIHGTRIADIAALKQAGVNMRKLAERVVEIFFTQVFRDSFFHADMHPGNLFVKSGQPENPQIIAVDFGIMGSLSPFDQNYLALNFMAFFQRDYRKVAILHVESGWVPKGTRVEVFEAAIRGVCEPIFARPLKDISFGQLLMRLFQTASRFHMEIMPQLLLLQKTLINIEGLARLLYPDLDLWGSAKPILERWMQEKYSIKNLVKNFRENVPRITEKLLDSRLDSRFDSQIEKDKVEITAVSLSSAKNRLGFLACGVILVSVGIADVLARFNYFPMPSILTSTLIVLGLILLFKSR